MSDKNYRGTLLAKRRFWKTHIQSWTKSCLTQNEYCRRNRLAIKKFWYWKKKFNISHEPAAPVSFVPVAVERKESQAISRTDFLGLTLFLNDLEIRVSNEFNAITLTRVVSTLLGDNRETAP
jgi:hypothetical protein